MIVSQVHKPLSRGGDFADGFIAFHKGLILQFLDGDILETRVHIAMNSILKDVELVDAKDKFLLGDESHSLDSGDEPELVYSIAEGHLVGHDVVGLDGLPVLRQFNHLGVLGSLLDVGIKLLFGFSVIVVVVSIGIHIGG